MQEQDEASGVMLCKIACISKKSPHQSGNTQGGFLIYCPYHVTLTGWIQKWQEK